MASCGTASGVDTPARLHVSSMLGVIYMLSKRFVVGEESTTNGGRSTVGFLIALSMFETHPCLSALRQHIFFPAAIKSEHIVGVQDKKYLLLLQFSIQHCTSVLHQFPEATKVNQALSIPVSYVFTFNITKCNEARISCARRKARPRRRFNPALTYIQSKNYPQNQAHSMSTLPRLRGARR